MKSSIYYLLFVFTAFSSVAFSNTIENKDSIPELNKRIIAFVDARMGKKVGDGQCWALAAEALDAENAVWNHEYKFGREINPADEPVFPGDIIQFNDVTIKYRENNMLAVERYALHTAVIYQVKEDGTYTIANQNVDGVLSVKLTTLRLNAVIRGSYKIFRPQR